MDTSLISRLDELAEKYEAELVALANMLNAPAPPSCDPSTVKFPKGFDKWSEARKSEWIRGVSRAVYFARCADTDEVHKKMDVKIDKLVKQLSSELKRTAALEREVERLKEANLEWAEKIINQRKGLATLQEQRDRLQRELSTAREDALEEAAKICDAASNTPPPSDVTQFNAREIKIAHLASEACAILIRKQSRSLTPTKETL